MLTSLKTNDLLDRTLQIYQILLIDKTTPMEMNETTPALKIIQVLRKGLQSNDVRQTMYWWNGKKDKGTKHPRQQTTEKTISGVFKTYSSMTSFFDYIIITLIKSRYILIRV